MIFEKMIFEKREPNTACIVLSTACIVLMRGFLRREQSLARSLSLSLSLSRESERGCVCVCVCVCVWRERGREGEMEALQRETQSPQLEENEAEALRSVKTLAISMDPAAQNVSDFDFLRFLHARDFDTQKSAKLLVQHLKWRRSFVPSGCVREQDIAIELGRKQIFLQGHDKFGCSIVILLTARHLAFERDLEEIKRLFVYTFDKATASNLHDQGKFMIIGDLEGWGLKNMDIRGYLAVLDILQNHYPERLRKLYLLHVPYLFWGAWKVVSPLVDKVTREKIVFVENTSIKETLMQEVDKDQLPTLYGGQQSFIPVQDYAGPNEPPRTVA